VRGGTPAGGGASGRGATAGGGKGDGEVVTPSSPLGVGGGSTGAIYIRSLTPPDGRRSRQTHGHSAPSSTMAVGKTAHP